MSYKLDDIQYNAALKLNSEYRYHHFLTNVKKGIEVFVLKKNDDILFLETDSEKEGTEENSETISVLPIWCHERYASTYAEKNEIAKGYEPQAVSLAVFIEKWLPQLGESGVQYAIFLVDSDDCNIVTGDELLKDLNLDAV